MRRRTLLQWLARLSGALPVARAKASPQNDVFTHQQRAMLAEVSAVVLPSELGKAGTEAVVKNFENYVREYHGGADTDHGYGFTRVVPKPPSPAIAYVQQLSSFSSPLTKAAIEQHLQQAKVKDLPRVPDGRSIVADLMSFYFRSSEANDLCYLRAIGRDQCRGLAGSELAPKPLRSVS